MDDLISIALTLFSILIGAAVTWFVSKRYYIRASNDLLEESKLLKQTSDLILYKLQHPHLDTELKYNDRGVSGLAVNMSANATVKVTASGNATTATKDHTSDKE